MYDQRVLSSCTDSRRNTSVHSIASPADLNPYHNYGIKVKTYNLQAASYNTCNLQPITACRPSDGISLLIERPPPDDRHHGRGAAHFLATFNFYCSCLLHVVTCTGFTYPGGMES